MSDLFDDEDKKGSGDLFSSGSGISGSDLFGEDDDAVLEDKLEELRERAIETGAPLPETEKPGIVSRIVDILSRSNYAIAGAAEELSKPDIHMGFTGPRRAGQRILREIFSGIGPIQGDKKTFGQLLEERGVPELGLFSTLVPALYSETGEGWRFQKAGAADPSGRGFLGFTLDVATDPLTYLTFGSSGLKFTGKSGVKHLSPEGIAELKNVWASHLPDLQRAMQIEDATERVIRTKAVETTVKDTFEKALVNPDGKIIQPKWVDPGGVKLFGSTIASAEAISKVSKPVAETLAAIPGGAAAINMAGASARKVEAVFNGLFHPFARLSGLPKGMYNVAVRLRREYTDNVATISAHYMDRWAVLDKEYRALEKVDPEIGKKFYDVREGTGTPNLNPKQRDLYNKVAALQDQMETVGLKTDVLDFEEVKKFQGRYFHHSYKNVDDMNEVSARFGKPGFYPKATERFQRDRPFESYAEAVEASNKLNQAGKARRVAGETVGIYPPLEPNYDVMQNMASYIHQFSEAASRKILFDEARVMMGRELSDLSVTRLFKLHTPRVISADERAKITRFFGKSKSVKGLQETIQKAETVDLDNRAVVRRMVLALDDARLSRTFNFRSSHGSKLTRTLAERMRRGQGLTPEEWVSAYKVVSENAEEATRLIQSRDSTFPGISTKILKDLAEPDGIPQAIISSVKSLANDLSDDGKRELFEELFTRINSTSQFAKLIGEFKDFEQFIPTPRVVDPGDLEPTIAHFGEKARYVQRSGQMWGEKPILIPELIADDIENLNSRLLGSKDWQEFQKSIQGYHKLNNWFKLGVYTFWLSSAFRDVYSNVALSMLDMGAGALARPWQTAKVLSGIGDLDEIVRVGNFALTRREWRRFAKDSGVIQGVRQRAELAGQLGPTPTKLEKLAGHRQRIDNFGRTQLWLNNINRGLTPKDAADKVREFLFDYGELSVVEKDLFRSVIPFYTFPRKAIGLHMDVLRNRPGRVINQIKPFRGRNDENSSMVQWKSEGLKLRLDKDGRTLTVLNGIDLPVRALDTVWSGSFPKTYRKLVSMGSPILKTPLEMAFGTSAFSGAPNKRAPAPVVGRLLDEAKAPKWLKDWVGYRKDYDEAGRPTYTTDHQNWAVLFMRSWAFSRIVTTSNRTFREYVGDDVNVAAATLDFLTSLKIDEMDMDLEMRKGLREKIRAVEDVLVRRGVMQEKKIVYEPREEPEIE